MNQESVTASQVQSTKNIRAQKIIALWNELNEVRNEYSDCGANDSDADWKIQATLYAISFCVLVDVPKTPKRYVPVGQGFFIQAILDPAILSTSNNPNLISPITGGIVRFKNSL